MRIGVVGAGNVGQAIARRLADRGHSIGIAFARSDARLATAAAAIGGDVETGLPARIAEAAEVIVLATPWAMTLAVAEEIASAAAGKVVWDATNPLRADKAGLEVGTTTSGGEELARALPGARVVKAVPPMAALIATAGPMSVAGRAPGIFVCGDDGDARATVLGLVADIGADGVDAGPLVNARYTEPLGMLMVQLAYAQGMGPMIATSLLRETAA